MIKQVRQDCGVTFIPKVGRQRFRNQLDLSMQRYLEWLSTDWDEYFAKKRLQPTFFLLGYQVHLGGTPLRGFRIGITTNGKTVCGLKSGKMPQEVDPGIRKLEARFRTPSWKLSTSTHDRRLDIFCFRLQQLRCRSC